VSEQLPDNPLMRGVAGRFYVGSDGGFTPEQYADMCMTALFESAKNYPLPLKLKVLEAKAEMAKVLHHYFAEAMADERRRIGRRYELHDKKQARLMLPSGMGERLDNGGVWDEALAPNPNP
jgi:hypothetical protein